MIRNLQELFRFRALIWALVVRHTSMRYRGSALGFLWSLLNPLCLMLVYTLVFQHYMRVGQTENYTIVLFCGLLPWIWFSSALNEGTSSLVNSGHLITKSMFPAHVLPAVAILTTMVNFLLSLPLLFLFMAVAGMEIPWTAALLPLLLLVQMLFLQGATVGLSAINVFFRDVQHLVANFLTLLFFLCPILYTVDIIPAQYRFTWEYNPAALLTIFYRDLILQGVVPELSLVVRLLGATLLTLLAGNWLFNRYRESFAEML